MEREMPSPWWEVRSVADLGEGCSVVGREEDREAVLEGAPGAHLSAEPAGASNS